MRAKPWIRSGRLAIGLVAGLLLPAAKMETTNRPGILGIEGRAFANELALKQQNQRLLPELETTPAAPVNWAAAIKVIGAVVAVNLLGNDSPAMLGLALRVIEDRNPGRYPLEPAPPAPRRMPPDRGDPVMALTRR